MKFEDYWEEKANFCVRFETMDSRIVNKIVALPLGTTKDEVAQIIITALLNVKKIHYVDEMDDVLSYINVG